MRALRRLMRGDRINLPPLPGIFPGRRRADRAQGG